MSPCMQPAVGDAVQLPVYDCWMIDWLIVSCVMLDLLMQLKKMYVICNKVQCATTRTKVGAAF